MQYTFRVVGIDAVCFDLPTLELRLSSLGAEGYHIVATAQTAEGPLLILERPVPTPQSIPMEAISRR